MPNDSPFSLYGSVQLVPTLSLLPSEEFSEERVQHVSQLITSSGRWTSKIALEEYSLVIMDGHHRFEVAKRLQLRFIPCLLLSYRQVSVVSRRYDYDFVSEDIVNRGLNGRLFPPKTTRHVFSGNICLDCDVPLLLLQ